MYIRNDNCESLVDMFGNRPQICMCYWKKIHLGIVKIWLGYEIYNLVNKEQKTLVKDNTGKPFYGKYLSTIEIKWIWK